MGTKILVVDDDRNICELLKLYLENDGYTVFVANDGQEAVEMFQSKAPELVLLDIMLPKMDGWQVCREIRKTSNTPIHSAHFRCNNTLWYFLRLSFLHAFHHCHTQNPPFPMRDLLALSVGLLPRLTERLLTESDCHLHHMYSDSHSKIKSDPSIHHFDR